MNTAHPHIPEDDLALFALALMPPEEAAYTLAHLKHCDLCRDELARMQGDLVGYAFTADMQDPAAGARTRLLDAVRREKKLHTPAEEPVLAPRSSILLDKDNKHARPEREHVTAHSGFFNFFAWSGWGLAACALALAGWQFTQRQQLGQQLAQTNAQTAGLTTELATQRHANERAARAERVLAALTDPAATQVALHLPAANAPAAKPEGHASYNPAKGELIFVASHLAPVPSGKTYELWVLPSTAGAAPVAAGLFRPDANGSASVLLPTIPHHVAAKGFGVTLEATGGSKTPTLPILLLGT